MKLRTREEASNALTKIESTIISKLIVENQDDQCLRNLSFEILLDGAKQKCLAWQNGILEKHNRQIYTNFHLRLPFRCVGGIPVYQKSADFIAFLVCDLQFNCMITSKSGEMRQLQEGMEIRSAVIILKIMMSIILRDHGKSYKVAFEDVI